MRLYHRLALFLSLLLLPLFGRGQSTADTSLSPTLKISRITPDEQDGLLHILISAYDKDGAHLELDKFNTAVFKDDHQFEGAFKRLELQKVVPIMDRTVSQSLEIEIPPSQILFLLDLSGSMTDDKLKDAKKAIYDILSMDLLANTDMQFAWFHDVVSEKNEPISLASFDQVITPLSVKSTNDTDLYRAILKKVRDLQDMKGYRAIILLTDGKNDTKNNPIYQGADAIPRISDSTLLDFVAQELDSTLKIFPVGLGKDADSKFLEALASATPSAEDYPTKDVAPTELFTAFQKIISTLSTPNYKLEVQPDTSDARYGTERRIFKVTYRKDLEAVKTVVLGSAGRKIDLGFQSTGKEANQFIGALTGVGILVLLLLVLTLSVPIYNNILFRRKYIWKYREVRVDNPPPDPLTLEAFQDDDLVVINEQGTKMMKLSSWKYYRENKMEAQAGDFTELFKLQASSGDFFSQRGVYKQLNWLWFGALGGFIAWNINAVLIELNWTSLYEFFAQLDQPNASTQIFTSVLNEFLVGIAMSIGIVGCLAIAEERGNWGKFKITKVLLRVLVGLLIGVFLYLLESTLIGRLQLPAFLSSVLGWTLFGTGLALVVSLFSSIEAVNALKGGLLAALLGGIVYEIFYIPFVRDLFSSTVSHVISWMAYGGILGYTLFTVVARLEQYELLCLSPQDFAQWKSPISKWLKDPVIGSVIMGSHHKNRVFLKWHHQDSSVQPKHARISYAGDRVYIEPLEGEVWINSQQIKTKTPLENGQAIQLGANGLTRLQFIAKAQETAAVQQGQRGSRSASLQPDNRSTHEVRRIRNQIQITNKR